LPVPDLLRARAGEAICSRIDFVAPSLVSVLVSDSRRSQFRLAPIYSLAGRFSVRAPSCGFSVSISRLVFFPAGSFVFRVRSGEHAARAQGSQLDPELVALDFSPASATCSWLSFLRPSLLESRFSFGF
jgi:hypothetical protein